MLHWVSWLISLTGICGLVVARGHYSIDVVLAYFVTSRLWWIYHAMATNINLKTKSEDNFLSRAWWYWMFFYFEKNVPSDLPRRYSISTPPVITRLWNSVKVVMTTGLRGRGKLQEESVKYLGKSNSEFHGIDTC